MFPVTHEFITCFPPKLAILFYGSLKKKIQKGPILVQIPDVSLSSLQTEGILPSDIVFCLADS